MDMTKTLASLAVIIVAVGMAWGLTRVAQQNKAANVEETNGQTEPTPRERNLMYTGPENVQEFKLEIVSPIEGEVVNKPGITLSGKTEALAEVFVDDKELKADENGGFSVNLTLDEGENEIAVTANNVTGEFAEKTIKVTYEAPE